MASAAGEEAASVVEEGLEVVEEVVDLEGLQEEEEASEDHLEAVVLASEAASLEVIEEATEAVVEEVSTRKTLLVNKALDGDQELLAEEAVLAHLRKAADTAARLPKEATVVVAVVDTPLAAAVLLLVLLDTEVTSKFQEALLAAAEAADTIAETAEEVEEEAMEVIEVVTATEMLSGRATKRTLFPSQARSSVRMRMHTRLAYRRSPHTSTVLDSAGSPCDEHGSRRLSQMTFNDVGEIVAQVVSIVLFAYSYLLSVCLE